MLELNEPQSTSAITTTRGRAASDEPNPFIDNGWLWSQYEAVKAAEAAKTSVTEHTKSVTVDGTWENRQAKNRQGELLVDADTNEPIMVDVLTGDAAKVVAMLRKAAELLEIGVNVQCVPVPGRAGKGKVEVKYLAKDRKRKKSAADSQ